MRCGDALLSVDGYRGDLVESHGMGSGVLLAGHQHELLKCCG